MWCVVYGGVECDEECGVANVGYSDVVWRMWGITMWGGEGGV